LSTHDAQLVRQYYYVDMSPSTYVDLGVAVRGHLAQGTYVHVRENLMCCTLYNCHNATSGHPVTIIGSRLYWCSGAPPWQSAC